MPLEHWEILARENTEGWVRAHTRKHLIKERLGHLQLEAADSRKICKHLNIHQAGTIAIEMTLYRKKFLIPVSEELIRFGNKELNEIGKEFSRVLQSSEDEPYTLSITFGMKWGKCYFKNLSIKEKDDSPKWTNLA